MAVPKDLAELLESGAHFGHQVRRWNPKMEPYIYTVRDGVHVFDLTKTAKLLDEACEFVQEQAAKNKTVVFIGTKRQAKDIVKEEAVRVGAMYITERWMGGFITNWDQISKRVKKLKEMKEGWKTGKYDKYTKKERVLINREIAKLDRFLGGVADLTANPDVLFVVDVNKEKVAVTEAKLRDVKVVAVVDTNGDPEGIEKVIPANDDAVRSIKYIVHRIAEAYAEGRSKVAKNKPLPEKVKQEKAAGSRQNTKKTK